MFRNLDDSAVGGAAFSDAYGLGDDVGSCFICDVDHFSAGVLVLTAVS